MALVTQVYSRAKGAGLFSVFDIGSMGRLPVPKPRLGGRPDVSWWAGVIFTWPHNGEVGGRSSLRPQEDEGQLLLLHA